MSIITKKAQATSVEELGKEELEDFVREILEQEGFPPQGWRRFVYFQDGCLMVTEEISENTYIVWEENVHPVFKIPSWEKYAHTIPVELEQHGLSWDAPLQDWINAFLVDSFEKWRIEDWL